MSKSAAVIGTAVGIALGSFAAAQIGLASHRVEQQASEDCWVKGGTYSDGKCETVYDRMNTGLSPEEKVCMGMGGQYIIKKVEGVVKEFTCTRDGKVLEIPDLRAGT